MSEAALSRSMSLLSRMQARIFPSMERREISLWLSQSVFAPLFLYNATMVASRRSPSISSFSQMVDRISWNALKAEVPSVLYTSARIRSFPGALPQLICFMAVFTSSSLGGRSRSSCVGC